MIVYRNGFTYIANIIVLASALIVFITVSNQTEQFRILAFECIIMGAAATFFYCAVVREPSLSKLALEREAEYKSALGNLNEKKTEEKKAGKQPMDWLKEAQFYIFGLVYMFARISLNTTATMLPLYLEETTKFEPKPGMFTPIALASVPLAAYLFSLLYSVFL